MEASIFAFYHPPINKKVWFPPSFFGLNMRWMIFCTIK